MNKKQIHSLALNLIGLYLIVYYGFELLGKIGAGLLSAVLTEQIAVEMMDKAFWTSIVLKQAAPYLIMFVLGIIVTILSNVFHKKAVAEDGSWSEKSRQYRVVRSTVIGGIVLLSGLYSFGVATFYSFPDIKASLENKEMLDYMIKGLAPIYSVFLIQVILGIVLIVIARIMNKKMLNASSVDLFKEVSTTDGNGTEEGAEPLESTEEPVEEALESVEVLQEETTNESNEGSEEEKTEKMV